MSCNGRSVKYDWIIYAFLRERPLALSFNSWTSTILVVKVYVHWLAHWLNTISKFAGSKPRIELLGQPWINIEVSKIVFLLWQKVRLEKSNKIIWICRRLSIVNTEQPNRLFLLTVVLYLLMSTIVWFT